MKRWLVVINAVSNIDSITIGIAREPGEFRQVADMFILDKCSPQEIEKLMVKGIEEARKKADELNQKQALVEAVAERFGVEL